MIRVIIIDDEKPARDSLALLIRRYFDQTLVVLDKCSSLLEGVCSIRKNNPDLVFLDIEMPGESGLQLFSYFDKIDFSVIFTTAYREYAIQAVKVSAIDYLLKPINPKELAGSIALYEKRQLKTFPKHLIAEILKKLEIPGHNIDKIAFPTLSGFRMIKIKSILYCEAEQSYTTVYLNDGDKFLVSKSLLKVEELLASYSFFRIHKSFLVNLHYVKSFSRLNGAKVQLDNGVNLVVAVRRVDAFLEALTGHNNN